MSEMQGHCSCCRKRSRDLDVQNALQPPPRLASLPPPIVADYAPYAKKQLQDRWKLHQVANCAAQWDRYYSHNTVNGYKDRHYLLREFVELGRALDAATESCEVGGAPIELVEIGCGVGNAVLPMLEAYHHLGEQFVAYGFDISRVAVQLLEKKVAENALLRNRLACTTHDLAEEDFAVGSGGIMPHPVGFGTIIFVLCSVPVDKLPAFASRVACLIRSGGVLFVRDYCVGDLAQVRFANNKRHAPPTSSSQCDVVESAEGQQEPEDASSNTFLRQNGTLSHFFTVDSLTSLMVRTGQFKPIGVEEVVRDVENRKEGVVMQRRFVQGRFLRL